MTETLNFEQYLDENDSLIYSNVGVSMLPLLRQGKDLFILTKKKRSKRCKIGDVVLYRKNNRYILHRIIDVRKDDYVILGDNCIEKEYGIKDVDILAIMTGFIRNGKKYSVNDFAYQAYSFIWLKTTSIRILLKKLLHCLKNYLKNYVNIRKNKN